MFNEYKPTIFMLVSTLSLSLSGVISKYLTGQFSLPVLIFLRLFFPAIIMMFMMAMTRFMFPQKNLTVSFVMRALCVAGCQMCFLYSLNTLTLVESVVLFATGPLFIPIFEKIFGDYYTHNDERFERMREKLSDKFAIPENLICRMDLINNTVYENGLHKTCIDYDKLQNILIFVGFEKDKIWKTEYKENIDVEKRKNTTVYVEAQK